MLFCHHLEITVGTGRPTVWLIKKVLFNFKIDYTQLMNSLLNKRYSFIRGKLTSAIVQLRDLIIYQLQETSPVDAMLLDLSPDVHPISRAHIQFAIK